MEPVTPSAETQRKAMLIGVGFGVVVTLLGAGALLGAWLDPSRALAPMWVIELACGAFIVAGLSFVFEALGRRLVARLFSFSIIPMLGLTAIWALFLDDKGVCSIGSGLFGLSVRGTAPDWTCRAAFLSAAIVTIVAALGFVLAAGLRRRAARNRGNQAG